MKILANCGDSMYVVSITDDVFALANLSTETCIFSSKPDSFYKQGYFKRFEKKITAKQIKEIRSFIAETIGRINDKNKYEFCLGKVPIEEAKKAMTA